MHERKGRRTTMACSPIGATFTKQGWGIFEDFRQAVPFEGKGRWRNIEQRCR